MAFLEQLRRRRQGPMMTLWDRSNIHQRCALVEAFLARHPEILTEQFPGYAPDANPDDGVWGWTKHHRLANCAAEELSELRCRPHRESTSLGKKRGLLASFIRHAKAPLRL